MFDQMKMAKKMMAGMSADDIKDLMKQARDSKKMLEEQIRNEVDKRIKEMNLVSRDEVAQMIADKLDR